MRYKNRSKTSIKVRRAAKPLKSRGIGGVLSRCGLRGKHIEAPKELHGAGPSWKGLTGWQAKHGPKDLGKFLGIDADGEKDPPFVLPMRRQLSCMALQTDNCPVHLDVGRIYHYYADFLGCRGYTPK